MIEWSGVSLENVLRAFGFNGSSTNLIMQCVSTVQFTLLLNGGICANFSPSRELRQGDPLSPYLFILGSEVLLRLIDKEVNQGKIKGVKIGVSAPPITKLSYADDLILFCRALGRCQNFNEFPQHVLFLVRLIHKYGKIWYFLLQGCACLIQESTQIHLGAQSSPSKHEVFGSPLISV
jgi:hypothetical protein